MKRFIVLTFLFMGWGFYELSGGADFVPETREVAEAPAAEPAPAPAPEFEVTRSEPLTTFTPPSPARSVTAPAVAEPPEEITLAGIGETPAPPAEEVAEEVYVFQSLAEGAPVFADILQTEPVTAAAPQAADLDLRQVAGTRVNMRTGPGTSYSVIVALPQGTETEVMDVVDGWAQIRVTETGALGWMAERLLTGG